MNDNRPFSSPHLIIELDLVETTYTAELTPISGWHLHCHRYDPLSPSGVLTSRGGVSIEFRDDFLTTGSNLIFNEMFRYSGLVELKRKLVHLKPILYRFNLLDDPVECSTDESIFCDLGEIPDCIRRHEGMRELATVLVIVGSVKRPLSFHPSSSDFPITASRING